MEEPPKSNRVSAASAGGLSVKDIVESRASLVSGLGLPVRLTEELGCGEPGDVAADGSVRPTYGALFCSVRYQFALWCPMLS